MAVLDVAEQVNVLSVMVKAKFNKDRIAKNCFTEKH